MCGGLNGSHIIAVGQIGTRSAADASYERCRTVAAGFHHGLIATILHCQCPILHHTHESTYAVSTTYLTAGTEEEVGDDAVACHVSKESHRGLSREGQSIHGVSASVECASVRGCLCT